LYADYFGIMNCLNWLFNWKDESYAKGVTILFIFFAQPIAALVIGSVFWNDCPVRGVDLTLWMVLSGAVEFIFYSIYFVHCFHPRAYWIVLYVFFFAGLLALYLIGVISVIMEGANHVQDCRKVVFYSSVGFLFYWLITAKGFLLWPYSIYYAKRILDDNSTENNCV
jgi:hypothetical protein